MTPRKRPVICMVLGILSIIFGGLGIAKGLCCTIAGVGGYLGFQAITKEMKGQDREVLDNLTALITDNMPGVIPVLIGSTIISLVLAIVQLVAGIGLVRVKNWGRWTSVVWGVMFIVFTLATVFWTIAYVYPLIPKLLDDTEKLMQKIEEQERRKGAFVQPRQPINAQQYGSGNPILDNIVDLGTNALMIAYGLLVIIWMALPQTGAAIAAYNRPEDDYTSRGPPEAYDEDYQRHRRESFGPPGTDPPREIL